jgi:large subunit ribosomal protein L15
LAAVSAEVIDLAALKATNIIPQAAKRVKVIASGKLDRAVALKGLAITKGARASIIALGGTIEE